MAMKTDAQARRSREWLLEALISLMEEKEYAQITISELAKRADLDRRTFYRHYGAKDQIIIERIRELAKIYEAVLRSASTTTREIALAYFRICRENGQLLMLLYRHKLLPLLLDELNRLFPILHAKHHAGPDPYAPFDMEYALSYHVGGFWNVMCRWLARGMVQTPQELADMIGHMLPEYI